MMMLAADKQKMYYALYKESIPVYETDKNGNIIYEEIDGEMYPLETGETMTGYTEPVEFFGNIAMSGGESQAVEFGLDVSAYSAVIVAEKGYLPIDETSLIWHTSDPKFNKDGMVDKFSADYKVVKVSPSLNVDKFVLDKVVK